MKLFLSIIIMSLMFLIGCQAKKSDSVRFEEFVLEFSEDSTFQKEHIEFPLKMVSIDIMDNESSKLLYENDWRYTKLLSKENDEIKLNSIELVFLDEENKAKCIVSSRDTGIHIEYLFNFRNSEWTLIEVMNLSN